MFLFGAMLMAPWLIPSLLCLNTLRDMTCFLSKPQRGAISNTGHRPVCRGICPVKESSERAASSNKQTWNAQLRAPNPKINLREDNAPLGLPYPRQTFIYEGRCPSPLISPRWGWSGHAIFRFGSQFKHGISPVHSPLIHLTKILQANSSLGQSNMPCFHY